MEEETKTRERRRKLWKLLLPLCLIAAAAVIALIVLS